MFEVVEETGVCVWAGTAIGRWQPVIAVPDACPMARATADLDCSLLKSRKLFLVDWFCEEAMAQSSLIVTVGTDGEEKRGRLGLAAVGGRRHCEVSASCGLAVSWFLPSRTELSHSSHP